jgi:hypothetical protein
MIDELYDSAHREARAELNAGLAKLFEAFARRLRNFRSITTGEHPCSPESSPPSRSQCR